MMRLVILGGALAIGGFGLLFAIASQWIESSPVLSISAFAATLGGMYAGLIGLGRRLRASEASRARETKMHNGLRDSE